MTNKLHEYRTDEDFDELMQRIGDKHDRWQVQRFTNPKLAGLARCDSCGEYIPADKELVRFWLKPLDPNYVPHANVICDTCYERIWDAYKRYMINLACEQSDRIVEDFRKFVQEFRQRISAHAKDRQT